MLPAAIIKIGINPVLVQLGPLAVHWYGAMYVIGILAGVYFSIRYAERVGINPDQYYAVFWPVVVACLVGGRLYYVVQSNFGWYLQHPQQILATWEGGMAFYGAVFLGAIVCWIFCRRTHIPVARALDVAAIFIPVAQTIGRIGNLVNGDIRGYPSSLPWATVYTNPSNTFVPSHTIAYDPAAAYELLFSLALFLLVWRLRFAFRVPGTLFFLWLVGYSVGQFALFFGRANIVVALGLKQAQLTAIAVMVVAVPAYVFWARYYQRRWNRGQEAELDEAEGGAPEAASSGSP